MLDADQGQLAESVKRLGFSTEILFPLIYSDKLVVKYENIRIISNFYKNDLRKTIGALERKLNKVGNVDQRTARIFITFFTEEYLRFKKSQREIAAASPPPKKSCIPAGNFRLSPTYNIKLWIERQVREYAQQIGITELDIPHIVFTREELRAAPVKLRAKETKKCLGICLPEARTIFIHVKKHSAYERVKDTIIRELLYYRFRDLKDDTKFEKRVYSIKCGKKYKAKSIASEKIPPLVIYRYAMQVENDDKSG